MNKALKRVSALLLVLAMSLSMMIASVWATEASSLTNDSSAPLLATAMPTSGKCGTNATWTLENGVLTISGTGKVERPEYDSDDPWSNIQSVVVNNCITSLDDHVFMACDKLTKVSLPDSLTSIGECAFTDCSKLTSINIPGKVTRIQYETFCDCKSLTSISLPASITSIGEGAFDGCSKLTSINIPGKVTSIGSYAFSECGRLTSIKIPGKVTSIGRYAFFQCGKLTSISIPGKVNSIGGSAFYRCKALSKLSIGNGVKTIGNGAFLDCPALKKAAIPASVKTIGKHAFGYRFDKNDYYEDDYHDDDDETLFKRVSGFSISGKKGSAAEKYAKKNKITFKSTGKVSKLSAPGSFTAKYDSKKKQVALKWKKNTKGKGYQVQYSTDKSFKKGVKTKKINKNKTVTATVKPKKGTWYFRIRTVKGSSSSAWSSVKKVTVK